MPCLFVLCAECEQLGVMSAFISRCTLADMHAPAMLLEHLTSNKQLVKRSGALLSKFQVHYLSGFVLEEHAFQCLHVDQPLWVRVQRQSLSDPICMRLSQTSPTHK